MKSLTNLYETRWLVPGCGAAYLRQGCVRGRDDVINIARVSTGVRCGSTLHRDERSWLGYY